MRALTFPISTENSESCVSLICCCAVGLGAEGVFVGSGVTQININSSGGSGVVASPVHAGIVTATITSGVSIGLAIALGS